MLNFLEKLLLGTDKLFIQGNNISISKKSSSQYVTDLDISVEKYLIDSISKHYPSSGIISEERGFISSRDSSYFIIDPIDGTSNYMNGLEWYGVMVAFYSNQKIQFSGIYLPSKKDLYLAELNNGAYLNSKRFKNNNLRPLSQSLVSCCMDKTDQNFSYSFKKNLYVNCLKNFLNVRSTNSCFDYAYACEGKLSLINLENRVWDLAAVSLIAKESGNIITDINGKEIILNLDEDSLDKDYSVVISDKIKHNKIISFIHA